MYLHIKNAGSLALKYKLGINVTSETESTNVDNNPLKLSDLLVFKTIESNAEIVKTDDRSTLWSTTDTLGLNEYSKEDILYPQGTVDQISEQHLALVVYMPTTIGNEANYKLGEAIPTINLGIKLDATQTPYEKDSFDDQYDTGATIPISVSSAEELLSVLDSEKDHISIALTNDIDMGNSSIDIKKNKEVDLDLSVKEITRTTDGQGQNCIIGNSGILNISDSVGSGKNSLNCGEEGVQPDWYAAGIYTILNRGTINIFSGIIENNTFCNPEGGNGKMIGAIDNNSTIGDVITNITGGTVVRNRHYGIRLFCNSTIYKNEVNVSGGHIAGGNQGNGIWLQTSNENRNLGEVNIVGGEITGTPVAIRIDNLYPIPSEDPNVKLSITGGMVYVESELQTFRYYDEGVGNTQYNFDDTLIKNNNIEGEKYGKWSDELNNWYGLDSFENY